MLCSTFEMISPKREKSLSLSQRRHEKETRRRLSRPLNAADDMNSCLCGAINLRTVRFHLIMNLHIPFTCALFAVLSLTVSCDSAEKRLLRAEQALKIGEYAEAADHFKAAYRLTPASEKAKRGEIAFRMGESYNSYGYTARALGSYRNAVRYNARDSSVLLREGETMMAGGDYKNAATALRDYLAAHPGDSVAARALHGALSASARRSKASLYTVKLSPIFNSNRADYAPALLGSGKEQQLYFTSTRSDAMGNRLSGITGQKNGDLYVASKDEKGNWKRPEPVETVNTPEDEGAAAFSPDGKTMYLTYCPTDPNYPRSARIYTSSRTNASWSKPQPLDFLKDTLSSFAHPAVSPDGHWLYFVSDMPGGEGRTDLWRADLRPSKGAPLVENLGPRINTPGREMFPTFSADGTLYFSSDGHGGMGGLDLFRATEDTVTHKWSVEALPPPMNSQGNDFGMTFDGLHHRGFFSSSRSTGGRGWDKIYEFSYPERLLTVKGWVYEQDGYELPAAQVQMVGSDGTNLKLPVKPDGSFEQAVKPGTDYVFLASCRGYLNTPNRLHVDSTEEEHQYVLQFPLPSMQIPVLVRNVFYAFDRADITPESSQALDRLVHLLKENPHITIELAAHTDYRGSETYNVQLSQRRAESVVRYLTERGIPRDRLTPRGYGKNAPKIVNKKLTETYTFLHEGDTLTEAYVRRLPEAEQDICNGLNRRTEFRVLRTTYGLYDKSGQPVARPIQPAPALPKERDDDDLEYVE